MGKSPFRLVLVLAAFAMAGSVLLLGSCNPFRSDLDQQLAGYLADCVITPAEYEELKKYLVGNRKESDKLQLLTGNRIDAEAYRNFVLNSKAYRRQQKQCPGEIVIVSAKAPEKTIVPKLYLERSGSMVYYDNPESSGQFKDALVTILNHFDYLRPEQSLVYVVNDSVRPCPLSFTELIRERDIFAATRQGNASYTDFDVIFRSILDSLQPDQMAVMFSDLIYSTRDMQEKNPQKILSEAENLTSNIFGRYARDYATLILKLNAQYIGNYYTYKDTPSHYVGMRPYYICFFARNATMDRFLTSEKYAQVRDFSRLPEFENFYFFSNAVAAAPDYTVVLGEGEGRFKQASDEKKARTQWVHALEDVTPDQATGKLTIHLAVDFSKLMLPEEYLTDPAHYEVESPDDFRVIAVEKIRDKNFYPGTTHKLSLSTSTPHGGKREVRIHLRKRFPVRWIEQSHSANDQNVDAPDFAKTTFGFASLMQGIYNAYHPQHQGEYCTLKIQLTH